MQSWVWRGGDLLGQITSHLSAGKAEEMSQARRHKTQQWLLKEKIAGGSHPLASNEGNKAYHKELIMHEMGSWRDFTNRKESSEQIKVSRRYYIS